MQQVLWVVRAVQATLIIPQKEMDGLSKISLLTIKALQNYRLIIEANSRFNFIKRIFCSIG